MVLRMIKKLPRLANPGANTIVSGNPSANAIVSGNPDANTIVLGNPDANASGYPYANRIANAADSADSANSANAANLVANQRVAPYTVYLDNYFTSIALFKELRDIQCGACGTTRPQNGITKQLTELKEHVKSIRWGTLYASQEQGVLCFA